MPARQTLFALAALVTVASACGVKTVDGAGSDGLPETTPVPTISGVGELPDVISTGLEQVVRVPRPVNDDGSTAELVGDTSDGNRILLIGDSILAGSSSRYGGEICDKLVSLGWAVQVEAEPSRFVEFGNKVLDDVLVTVPPPGEDDSEVEGSENDQDWDAAVVFLGSNYRGDPVAYEEDLREILDRLAPRPTLLFTVTEYRSSWAEVNEVVAKLGAEYDRVTIVDWEEISQTPGVISGDGQHPTDSGRTVLAEAIGVALGPGMLGQGECLRSQFTDDSAVNGSGSGLNTSKSSSSSSGSSSSGSSSGGSSSGGSSSGTTPPDTSGTTEPTNPPATDPPSTDPPSTDPPATSPPETSPPETSPPTTSPPATSPPTTSPPVTSGPVAP